MFRKAEIKFEVEILIIKQPLNEDGLNVNELENEEDSAEKSGTKAFHDRPNILKHC